MTDSPLTPQVMAAFSEEIEKLSGFSLIGRGAKGAADLGFKAVGSVAKSAVNNPKAALMGTAALGATGLAGAHVLKKSKQGLEAHSMGSLPGTSNSVTGIL
jgi:hypothetical protein